MTNEIPYLRDITKAIEETAALQRRIIKATERTAELLELVCLEDELIDAPLYAKVKDD